MRQDVIIKITGLHDMMEDESEHIELTTEGKYYKKNGKHYILYDEMLSQDQKVTKSMIKVSPDRMEITRKGEASGSMVFEENHKNMSFYSLPFGQILFGIDAKNLQIEEKEEQLTIQADYTLEIEEQMSQDCHISINVQ